MPVTAEVRKPRLKCWEHFHRRDKSSQAAVRNRAQWRGEERREQNFWLMCVTLPAAGRDTRDQHEVLYPVFCKWDELLVCLAYESLAVPVKL